jgi:hypothetical protein
MPLQASAVDAELRQRGARRVTVLAVVALIGMSLSAAALGYLWVTPLATRIGDYTVIGPWCSDVRASNLLGDIHGDIAGLEATLQFVERELKRAEHQAGTARRRRIPGRGLSEHLDEIVQHLRVSRSSLAERRRKQRAEAVRRIRRWGPFTVIRGEPRPPLALCGVRTRSGGRAGAIGK